MTGDHDTDSNARAKETTPELSKSQTVVQKLIRPQALEVLDSDRLLFPTWFSDTAQIRD